MWGRELRATLAFVLLSLLVGAGAREWRRTHEARFQDLVARLASEATDPVTLAPPDSQSIDPRGPVVPSDAGRPAQNRVRRAPDLRPGAIDINRADGAELERLPGIGPALAARILADRAARGTFPSTESLLRVPGIGRRTLDRIRPYLTADDAAADSRPDGAK